MLVAPNTKPPNTKPKTPNQHQKLKRIKTGCYLLWRQVMALWQDRMLAAWPQSLLQDHLLAAWPWSLLPHSSPTPEKLLTIPLVNKCPKHVGTVLVLQQGKYFYDMFLTFTLKVKTSRAPLTLCCVVIVVVNHVINHVINLYWGLLIWSLHIHLRATTGAVVWVIIWFKEKWIKICIS